MRNSPFHGVAGAVRWGSRIFVACGRHGLKVFELRGDRAELVTEVDAFPAFDLVARGEVLAVAAGERGVVLLHAGTLRPLRVWVTPFPAYALRWRDGTLTALSPDGAATHFATVPARALPALAAG